MNKSNNLFLYILGFFVLSLFLLRIPSFFTRFLVLFLFLAAVTTYLFQLWKSKRTFAQQDEVEKGINDKMTAAKEQITKMKEEKIEIENNIVSLRDRLFNTVEITPKIRIETERLIQEFEQELNLRNTKIEFHETCLLKLQSLLQNFRFSKEIANKQESLKKLRAGNEDDIANFEALKTQLEFERIYLNTIDELSLKMLDSKSLQDAEGLRLELETITKELREL